MDRRSRIFAPLLAVAVIVMAGGGFYAYALHDRLAATLVSISALEQDRNLWKSKAEQAEGMIDGASASLDHCSAEVDTLRSQLVLSAPAPRGPRS